MMPSVLPLSNSVTADPNDQVVGIDFSGGMASVVAQLNLALGGSNLQFSGSGSTLTVLNNTGFSTVDAASVTTTQTDFFNGSPELALFTDNGMPYTGAIRATGSQITGLAGRLGVNNALVADPSRLVRYSASTAAGDTTRSDFILTQLTTAKLPVFAGIGCRQRQCAVQRLAAELHAAVHQHAGRSGRRRGATRRRAGCGAQHVAGKDVERPRASTSTRRWPICWRCRTPIRPMRA